MIGLDMQNFHMCVATHSCTFDAPSIDITSYITPNGVPYHPDQVCPKGKKSLGAAAVDTTNPTSNMRLPCLICVWCRVTWLTTTIPATTVGYAKLSYVCRYPFVHVRCSINRYHQLYHAKRRAISSRSGVPQRKKELGRSCS